MSISHGIELSYTASQKQKKKPTCGYCARRLGYEYYFTCRECGATFCYIHSDRHKHEKPKQTLVS